MTEEPRNWDREMAEIDKAIAKQPAGGTPATPPRAGQPVPPPQRRFVALAWFWTVFAGIVAVGLLLWPYDRGCGIKLIFFLGAAVVAVVMGLLGALASWSHRQGLPHLLSLLVIVWAGVMAVREILPRVGYARQALEWTCPDRPPAAVPAPTGQ